MIVLILATAPSTVNGQSRDSLATMEDRLREETDLFIRNALRDGIISSPDADSLQRITQYSAGDGVSLTVLRGIIQDLDSLYDASMKDVNTYYEESMTFYRVSGMLPSILEIPEELLSPRERRARIEQDATRTVMTSMANTFGAEKPSRLVEYIIKFSNVFFHNDYGLAGKAIPQRGGLYYIYVPPMPPQPSVPYEGEWPPSPYSSKRR